MQNDIFMAGPWITDFEEKFVLDALRNGWYGKNAYAYVEKFEYEFANYHDRKYSLMTPNCTTSIHLLLAGLGIQDGDEVIVPECTWIASAAPITYQRATTVFADIDPINWCIDPIAMEEKITSKTKAVIVVDLYGNMPNMDVLQSICDKHQIYLIEDAAESLGSKFKNTRAGKFGIASVFSFHRTKTITTGEGGMLLMDDENLYKRCKFLRDHGRAPGTYFNTEITFKYMPSNLAASLGYAQFLRIEELVAKKRWIWQKFKESFIDLPDIYLNPEPEGVVNSVWCTALVFGKSHSVTKDYVMNELNRLGLPSRPFFYPLTSLPAFGSKSEEGRINSPIAYDISERAINLPCAFNVNEEQIKLISETIKLVLKNVHKNMVNK
ncbi:DegT/DnrJ/EryC1/StrS family aminotransferase [Fluviispira multicolorata]|nr:DegT/DnrJ/EryC1/StrS family aminotransferase [Fluviispira multicolorata]